MNKLFSITPAVAACDKTLSDSMFRTLACLGAFADTNGFACPGLGALAEMRGVSRPRISMDIKELAKKGYVQVTPRFQDGSQKSNMYRVVFESNGEIESLIQRERIANGV